MRKSALKLVYFSILCCLEAVSSPIAVEPLSVTDNLVVFAPEIKVNSSFLCQGVRLSKELLATAPECVLKIRELSDYKPIAVRTAQGNSLGEVSDSKLDDSQKEMLLPLSLDEESVSGEKYPELYNATSAPEQAFAYSIDYQGQLARQPVMLGKLTGTSFVVSSEVGFLSGSPVFDIHGHIVCILTSDSQCQILTPLHQSRAKRGAKEGVRDDDDDDDDDNGWIAQELGIFAGVLVATVTTVIGLFYLASYIKAHSKGMPANVFWPGILSLQYCSYCSLETALPAILGMVLCPCGTIAPLVGCPVSAYLAVSKWVNDYASTHSEHTPIINQQPLPYQPPQLYQPPPQY